MRAANAWEWPSAKRYFYSTRSSEAAPGTAPPFGRVALLLGATRYGLVNLAKGHPDQFAAGPAAAVQPARPEGDPAAQPGGAPIPPPGRACQGRATSPGP